MIFYRLQETLRMEHKKVLVVGCGGIGCEVVKLLYLHGCKDVSVLDFDIIEVSNLNRQLLFSNADIRRGKSEVAAEKYKALCPNAKVRVYKESIYLFGLEFFRTFDLVLSCLDNDEARSYVNIHCILASVPMVDGGSAGLLGQSLYFDGTKECFNCIPRRTRRDVPVCTIRSFPENFTHCVVWAKEYFLQRVAESKDSVKNNPYE